MLRGAEREEHRRLRCQEDAERGDELGERRGGAERPVDRELDDHDDEHDEYVGQRDRERRRDGEAELTGPERPEREAREHGDRACGQVDEAGAPVRDHDADRDGGDRGPGPETEQEEEEYLVHVVPWESADGAGVEPAPSDEGSSFVDCYLPGGPIQPEARLNANLPW